jgi:MOSC domain-containing protein
VDRIVQPRAELERIGSEDGGRAAVEPPRGEGELPPVRISLPDGTSVTSDSVEVDRGLSAHFERNVTLGRDAPEDFTIEELHPDVERTGAGDHGGTVTEQRLGATLFAELGMASPVPAGSFFDVFPLSTLITSTLSHASGLRPQSRFDPRRFRMNVIVHTERPGFIENDWVGRELRLGDTVRIQVALPDPRCVMTTLAQGDLPKDADVLRTLVRHNGPRMTLVDPDPFRSP